jgi:ABC-2 type transport system permease protein
VLAPKGRHRRPGPLWAHVVRSLAFVRKELAEIVRQPRLLALLVAGPFVLLFLFGAGYSQQQLKLRTTFVGPRAAIYENTIAQYADDLSEFIDSQGYVNDEGAALDDLDEERTDVVVVFPAEPVETVLSGERAVIRVVHDEIDPLQQSAIEIAAQLAIQELNSALLSTLADEVQQGVAPAGALVRRVGELAAQVEQGGEAEATAETARADLVAALGQLTEVLDGSISVIGRLESDEPDVIPDLEQARASAVSLRDRVAQIDAETSAAEIDAVAADARGYADRFGQIVALDPAVLVRPFDSEIDNVVPVRIEPTDYFTPASVALLLQHLAVTFAALSLVRDRRTGLFELLRIGPLSATEILIGKCFAYLLVAGAVTAGLLAGAVVLLDVPLEGSVVWLAVMVGGVALAALAMGMVLSLMSVTESQAVQFAMLSLLAGLFFSGFVLSVDDLAYPVKAISWLLPVTYGIRAFQDVMLRGQLPNVADFAGLSALVVAYGSIAVFSLQRKLRSA